MQKKKVLKLFCIGLYAQREEFFHQIVGLYYLRKSNHHQIILIGQKRPCARWDYGKIVHYATLWMTPMNVQDVNVFLAHVCECF